MLLINPPVVRLCEPPPGIVRLAAFLRSRGVECRILDAGLEGVMDILETASDSGKEGLSGSSDQPESSDQPGKYREPDKWTDRALRGIPRNLDLLRSPKGYTNFDRYSRAVNDLQRALQVLSPPDTRIGLANYEDDRYSPLSSRDLIAAAGDFEISPFFSYYSRRIPEVLADFHCSVIGISLNFLSQAVSAFALLGFIRARFPEKKLILGGGLVTSWVRQGIIPPDHDFAGCVDALIPGRGEDILHQRPDLFIGSAAARFKLPADPGPGTAQAVHPPFDELPMDAYLSPGLVLPWNFTYGCAWRKCTFCPEKAEKNEFYSGSPEEGAGELGVLTSRFKPSLVHLTDNEIPPAFLRNLAANPPGAPWYGFCRFSRVLEDRAFCRDLAASGCVMLQLGLESGDQNVLDTMEKGIRVENALKILENLKEAGIGTYIYLLFGTPAEDLPSARKTLEVIRANIGLMDFFNLAIFNLPVSSDLAAELDTASFYSGDLSLYSEFSHPKGWNRGEVRRFLSGEFISDPEVRRAVKRNPPVFTSSHAPFFYQCSDFC